MDLMCFGNTFIKRSRVILSLKVTVNPLPGKSESQNP